jgi:hypothetical protein
MPDLELEELKAPKINRVRGRIAIKPYSSGEEKMGLEKYGEALFPGTFQYDHIGLTEKNGYKTYITGLDEKTAEVQRLPDAEKRAKIRSIREVVTYLENTIANNYDVSKETCFEKYGTPEDDFWKKVTTFNSTGPDKFDAKGDRIETYWDKVELKISNDGKELDLTNPHDLVIFHAIEAGGLSLVAPSMQIAINEPGYNFYLDQPEETSDIKTKFKKLRNKAGGYMDTMLTNDQNKLFYIAKLTATSGASMYKKGGPNYTPADQMYDDVCNYLDGKTVEHDTRVTVQRFLDYYDMPIDALRVRAIVKDATEMHLIEPKGDGQLYYLKMDVPMGRTIEDIVEYLKNKLNESVQLSLDKEVERHWRE